MRAAQTKRGESNRGAGFTLVELLVVVSILVILAMLVMPVLKVVKVKTGLGLCATNMQHLYEVQEIYLAGHLGYIPPMSAYQAGQGCASAYVSRWSSDDPWRLFFAGYYAKFQYIDEPTQLSCPDSVVRNGWAHAASMRIKLHSMPVAEWSNNPDVIGSIYGNYGLRWSGRKDKTYSSERLMFAEVSACFPHGPTTWEFEDMHGGRWYGEDSPSTMSMNIVSSAGRVLGLRNYTDTRQWVWEQRYYYPHNERTGDSKVAPVPYGTGDWSDAAYGFWSSFDSELFDGTAWPWGETLDEMPLNW